MANYKVTIANRTYEVRIEDDQLLVNGDQISYDMDSLNENGLHLLKSPNKNTEAHLEPNQNGLYEIQIEGNHLSAEVLTGLQSSKKKTQIAEGDIHSPMPGLVVDIMVKIGDRVKKGQTILIQEAMKMQMKLRAPSSGIVKFISTTPGTQVEKGVLLVSLAPTS